MSGRPGQWQTRAPGDSETRAGASDRAGSTDRLRAWTALDAHPPPRAREPGAAALARALAEALPPTRAQCGVLVAGLWRPPRRGPRGRILSSGDGRPSFPGGGPRKPRPRRACALSEGPAQPQGRRPTMLLLSRRRVLLYVYCPRILLLLSSGSYL